jgi:hypothetical protein
LGGLLSCDHQNVHRQAEVLADEVSVMLFIGYESHSANGTHGISLISA